jgi:hypothetical protein
VSDPAIAPERPWRTRRGVAHVLSAVLSPKSRAAKDAAQRAATTAALRSVSVDGAIGKGGFATARHTLCGTTGTASRVLIPGGRDSPLVSSRVSSATVPVQAVPTKGKRTPKARPPRFRATLPERCLQPWIDRFALEREDTKPHSKAARSRPSAARSAGGATRSALIARTPTSQSDSTAHELTRLIWRAFAACFLDRFTVGKDVASAHEFHSHHGGLGGVIGWSGRLPMSPAPVLTAWRERPPLVAGETAPPVKNGGRSRHGTDIDRLADVGGSTRAAKSAA